MANYPALEALRAELNHCMLDGGQQLTVPNKENIVMGVSYNNCNVIISLAESGKSAFNHHSRCCHKALRCARGTETCPCLGNSVPAAQFAHSSSFFTFKFIIDAHQNQNYESLTFLPSFSSISVLLFKEKHKISYSSPAFLKLSLCGAVPNTLIN